MIAEVVLRADEAVQHAFLHRTIAGGSATAAVPDAEVEVVAEDGEVLPFREVGIPDCVDVDIGQSPGLGTCYSGASHMTRSGRAIRAGERYSLRVGLPDGGVLEGVTHVPATFDLVRPAVDSCVLAADTPLEVEWTPSPGASLYVAGLRVHGLRDALADRGIQFGRDTLRVLGLAASRTDTTIVLPTEFGVFDRFDLPREVVVALSGGLPAGTGGEVVVTAVDRNYVNWVRGGVFHPSGPVRISSIRGDGKGVFASVVARRFTFTVEDSGDGPTCRG